MDLSFTTFDRETELTALPADLAALFVGLAERQAASPTVAARSRWRRRADPPTFHPAHGAFHDGMARAVIRWRAT
ncbi:hypothetical protein [Sphingomonas bacterium]|uniref:hypothetical protein n=1 Tax=Sphingomonas bacterium TaxID=1895847 RepID=UPI00157581AB|nr:hypothetical protein [Sphingomonas bacterium]